MIKYVKGDLFEGKDDIIIHQCNCFCNWGSGIVIPMKKHYPGAHIADMKTNYADPDKLGTYTSWTGPSIHKGHRITVINSYSQYGCGIDKRRTAYDALKQVFHKVNADFPTGTIGMPRIGCGLAGGDWNIVEEIINEEFKDRDVTIYDL